MAGERRQQRRASPLSLWERVRVRVPRPSRPHPPLRVGLSPKERRRGGVPLTLSLSKGVSGSLTAVVCPLKWFDKLTMSGVDARRSPLPRWERVRVTTTRRTRRP